MSPELRYRAKGRDRQKIITLEASEFIRRFLLHVLPKGFHRIRHTGLFANGGRSDNLARARELLKVEAPVLGTLYQSQQISILSKLLYQRLG